MVSEGWPTTDNAIKDTRSSNIHVLLKICDNQTRLGITRSPRQTQNAVFSPSSGATVRQHGGPFLILYAGGVNHLVELNVLTLQ